MINLILRRGWNVDGLTETVDRDWQGKTWRWRGGVGDWRWKDKGTGSEDKQEMANSSEKDREIYGTERSGRKVSDEVDDTQVNPRHNTVRLVFDLVWSWITARNEEKPKK